jgi:hypothetical protein
VGIDYDEDPHCVERLMMLGLIVKNERGGLEFSNNLPTTPRKIEESK